MDEFRCRNRLQNMDQLKNTEEKSLKRASPLTTGKKRVSIKGKESKYTKK